jgi:hypothetical protein
LAKVKSSMLNVLDEDEKSTVCPTPKLDVLICLRTQAEAGTSSADTVFAKRLAAVKGLTLSFILLRGNPASAPPALPRRLWRP